MGKFEKLQVKLPDLNGNILMIHPMDHSFYRN